MAETIHKQDGNFRTVIRQNKRFIYYSFAIAIIYFVVLRCIYPVPSFFSDSFTYVGAAARNQPVTFRPIMYSKLIQFCKLFSTTDVALVAAQYFLSVFVNLFLFLSCCWLFQLKRLYKWILFALLIVHPFYVFAANYISSDAFFNSLAVLWFTVLLWIMHRPRPWLITVHILLLAMLFMLRYNAIYFPLLTAIAISFTHLKLWKKITIIALVIAVVGSCIEVTSRVTKNYVGIKIFSGFSGWQLANNALHIVRFTQVDTTQIDDAQVRDLLRYSKNFFDTTHEEISTKASAWYMWHPNGPLKTYNQQKHNHGYFTAWNKISPLYSRFGKTIILQYPAAYLQRFVVPNAAQYIYPPLEIYESYCEGRDTLPTIATDYFHYTSNKVPRYHPGLQQAVFAPLPLVFFVANIFLLLAGGWYCLSRRFKQHTKLVNHYLLCFGVLLVVNFGFVILLAPTVFRYHTFVVILSFPIVLFLLSQLFTKKYQA
jgi:hypothetical protein